MATRKSRKKRVGKVVGEVKMRRLDEVKPNPWNPNRMDEFTVKSLKQGLLNDGWLSSQALLVWGKDDAGNRRDTIIDGEHRWKVARDLKFEEGPMVVLDGLTEAQAKAMTIKLNQKRGAFDAAELSKLVLDIHEGLDVADLGVELGFDSSVLDSILESGREVMDAVGSQPVVPAPAKPPDPIDMKGVQPNMRLPLVFFVENERLQRLKRIFKHPTLETELNGDLFLAVVEEYVAAHPEVDEP